MNKHEIIIPEGIEYISQYKEYSIPRGEHCIVDKGVTGCGYTEFALTNNDNIVLCSPRKLLLENKSEKHAREGHTNILYLDNSDLVLSIEEKIEWHIIRCREKNLPIKFLITYDSTWKIVENLGKLGLLNDFIFVVDEFQSIFLDSYFKSSVELDFVESLQYCQSVVYLSATPMLDKYLERLDEFKDLDFYYLNWDNTGYVEKIFIDRRRTGSLNSKCCEIILNYLNNKFPVATTENTNQVLYSREAVFYFNSVEEIIRIIKRCGLTPENTIVICSKTEENIRKLRKIKFTVGRVPLEGEFNPMFIFCTSAVYMGVDFFSECASSYVFADPNIECLALDISLDLPQIIGRQRNKKNPFKNKLLLFYKIKRTGETKLTEEEFIQAQESRRRSTKNLLEGFIRLTDEQRVDYLGKLENDVKNSNYTKDFVSISRKTGQPVYNTLIDISNERAWEVAQKDYQDTLSVTRALLDSNGGNNVVEGYVDRENPEVKEFLKEFFSTGQFNIKMRLYCEFMDSHLGDIVSINAVNSKIPDRDFFQFYSFYGTKGCSSRKYVKSALVAGLIDKAKENDLAQEVYKIFEEGGRYAMPEIKLTLVDLYKKLGISKTPKAKDLCEYFESFKTNITTPNGIKHGFKLGRRLK